MCEYNSTLEQVDRRHTMSHVAGSQTLLSDLRGEMKESQNGETQDNARRAIEGQVGLRTVYRIYGLYGNCKRLRHPYRDHSIAAKPVTGGWA
jgi:hypothetical protein